jgi:galactokinase/mevalonate kinase-like predicted kinase
MRILQELLVFPPVVAEAMSEKSVERFGRLIDVAWGLKKGLDPEATTPIIEGILKRIAGHIFGATLLGAGGGGFLLLVCRSGANAREVRRILSQDPPNKRARFFDFDINQEGLVVTVS